MKTTSVPAMTVSMTVSRSSSRHRSLRRWSILLAPSLRVARRVDGDALQLIAPVFIASDIELEALT
jgi:hypothetical protein